MTAVVIDASIAVKWFLPEIHSELAVRLLKPGYDLLAPDLICAEVGNVLWKKNLRKEISREETKGILNDFLRFPLQIFDSKILLDTAWSLSVQFGASVYDSYTFPWR